MLLLALRGGLPLAVSLAVLVLPTYALAAPAPRTILIQDACSPSFNVGIGPGTCSSNGGVPFSQFVDQLTRLQRVPEWRFTPGQVQVNVGEPFTATNVGGEEHTFTEVAAFGGGVVPFLNALAGTPVMAPECGTATIIPPGGSETHTEDKPETDLYQCCIHPWMHEVVTVKP